MQIGHVESQSEVLPQVSLHVAARINDGANPTASRVPMRNRKKTWRMPRIIGRQIPEGRLKLFGGRGCGEAARSGEQTIGDL